MNDEEARLLLRRAERERAARKHAEKFIEDRSRELYLKDQELTRKNQELTNVERDLRRERDTFIHHVERATGELVAIQSETEDLRRRMARMERSMAGAVNDLHRTFGTLNALAALVKGNPALRNELLSASALGEARVDQFLDEVEAVTSAGALSLVRDGTEDPRGASGSGSLAAPRAAIFDDDDDAPTAVRALGGRGR